MNVQPFNVHVPDAILHDLQKRLARTRWSDKIPDSAWNHGTDLGYLKELVDTGSTISAGASKKSN